MVTVKRGRPRAIRKAAVKGGHLKYVGLSPATLTRYRKCILMLYLYLDVCMLELPGSMQLLDFYLSEFINQLWLEGEPHGYAGATIAAVARFIPRSRFHVSISRQYVKNWERTLTRQRALPLSKKIVIGMAGAAYAYKLDDVACLLLVGFVGLLRTMEFLTLKVGDIMFLGKDEKAFLMLSSTKGTTRTGQAEQVMIHDPVVTRALRLAVKNKQVDELVYSGGQVGFKRNLVWLAGLFGVTHSNLTPYSLRRGGATWHFLRYGNLDATTVLGRWAQSRTARIYIHGAAADLAGWKLSSAQHLLLSKAQGIVFKRLDLESA